MNRDDRLSFCAVAVTVCGLLAVVLAAHLVVVAILKGMGI